MSQLPFVSPEWNAPKSVFVFTTTRNGIDEHGASEPPRDRFNLAKHVGDDNTAVEFNRDLLKRFLERKTNQGITMRWLNQTHSKILVDDDSWSTGINADAVMTKKQGQACLVMTADCVPIVIVSESGQSVAVLHCGWLGLYKGLITRALKRFSEDVHVWLGPAISQKNYEVDTAFYERFVGLSVDYRPAFMANRNGHYLCDLYQIARVELAQNGVKMVSGGDYCTKGDSRFFSHRQCANTGRMVTGAIISSL